MLYDRADQIGHKGNGLLWFQESRQSDYEYGIGSSADSL